jgi:hypothetical protein
MTVSSLIRSGSGLKKCERVLRLTRYCHTIFPFLPQSEFWKILLYFRNLMPIQLGINRRSCVVNGRAMDFGGVRAGSCSPARCCKPLI